MTTEYIAALKEEILSSMSRGYEALVIPFHPERQEELYAFCRTHRFYVGIKEDSGTYREVTPHFTEEKVHHQSAQLWVIRWGRLRRRDVLNKAWNALFV